MNRKISILFIVMLIFQTVSSSVLLPAQALAEGQDKIIDGTSFVDNEGNPIDIEHLNAGEAVNLLVSWTIPEKGVKAEDTDTYTTSEEILVKENQEGKLTVEELEVGSYEANTDDTITVIFSENAESLGEANGLFVIEAEIGTTEDEVVLAEDDEPQIITENIIDELKLLYEDGTEYQDGDFIEIGEDLQFELDWSLPNDHTYENGDYYEFQLPNQLKVYNEITGTLGDYGSYIVTTDGKVTFTFNESIEGDSNVEGGFWFDTELDEQEIKSTTEDLEIIYNDEVLDKITINVKPTGGQAIHKEGQPVDGSFNTEEIEWTVIINTTREALENAMVNDPILDGQELVLDSIVLQEVEVDLQGNVVEELGEVDVTNNSTIDELKLELGDTNKAYKLTFKTKMKEEEKDNEGSKTYPNTVYLNSDGQNEKQSGASVSVNRPKSMEKTSSDFNAGDRSIEWTVHANFNEKNLNEGDVITDEFIFTVGEEDFNDIFEIIEEDITIEQVDEFDADGKVVEKSDAKDLFDIQIEGNKVTYTLREDTNKAFVLNYKTQANDGTIVNNDGTIVNSVDLNGNTDTSSTDVVQQVGKKTNAGIDYENKMIDWTITINADKQDLRGFVLTDDFAGSGQKLVEDSIEISPEKQDATINLNPDDIPEGEGFEINFGDITDTYTITYKTDFMYDFEGEGTPNFENKVNISYETSSGDDYNLEIGDNVSPNQETRSNGAKNGTANNETKEITWTVDINYNQLELSDAIVKDAIADNQSLIDGSVKIYETTIGENGGITVGDDVTDQFTVTSNENQVDVDFGSIDQSYRVEFMTKDKDGIYNSDEVYENTAQFIPRADEVHNLTANVTLPNQGEFLGKEGLHNREDWTIDWEVDVNKSKSTLTDVKVKDDLGSTDAQILLEDSINVTIEGSDEELVEGEDYEITVDGNELIVHFPGEITDYYKITYSSYILSEEDADITNEAEIESVDEVITGNTETTETVQVKISTGGGTGEGETGGLTIKKVESGTDRPLEGVAFELAKEVGSQDIVVREGSTDVDGKLEWKGLKFGDYTLNEVIPEGYLGVAEQTVTISSEDPEGLKTLTIENERQVGTAKIVKVDAVTGEELAGAEFKITNKTTGQTYTLTTDENGEISEDVPFGEYTVEEVTAPNGYRVTEDIDNITVEIDETTEIEVTNEAIVEVAGEKTWIADADQELPESITVELLANNSKVNEKEVTAADDWTYSFTNLDKYDAEGNEIEYSIEELALDDYVSEKDGYDLTNIQAIDVSGEKTWVEVYEQYRPDSITVNLFANENEEAVEIVEVSAETDWTFEFTNLPKFDSERNEIKYTVEEVDVAGYTSEIEDFNITNTQKTTEVTGEKTWLDNDDATETRPESITVQVVNGDEVVQEQEVAANEDGEWKYTFTDLPKYDKEGNEIAYTVEEIAPEGYEAIVDGHDITNLRIGTTEVEITKIWEDEDEIDRPEKIKVNLLQNDEFYAEYEVKQENDWILIITDLPEFDEKGISYEYTIKEHDVPGYVADVDGFDITNTRSDVKTIELTKTWLDNDDAIGDRPDSIEVDLFRSITDGEKELIETFTLTKETDWTLEVEDLPAFDQDGKAYTYEIEELDVDGYETSIHGFDIVNLRTGETEVTGTKTWLDDNYEGRPESITVYLLANGEQIDEVDVTAESNWEYAFTELPMYDDQGVEISYTVDELDVNGYKKSIEGYNITNTLTGITSVEGTKTWIGDNESDRPSSIVVELLRNGEKIAELIVTADTDWKYSFTDLPAFDENGVAYVYTVAEQEVAGYTSEVDGYDITNTLIPHDPEAKDPEDPEDTDGKEIPKTATNMFNMIAIGFVLFIAGLIGLIYIRKTNKA